MDFELFPPIQLFSSLSLFLFQLVQLFLLCSAIQLFPLAVNDSEWKN